MIRQFDTEQPDNDDVHDKGRLFNQSALVNVENLDDQLIHYMGRNISMLTTVECALIIDAIVTLRAITPALMSIAEDRREVK